MTLNRVLLIGAGEVLCDAALSRRLNFLLVETPTRLKPELLKRAPEALVIDYENDQGFGERIKMFHMANPFEAVITLTEPALIPVAEIEKLLGLSDTNIQMVAMAKNKAKMRERLAECGVDDLPYRILNDRESALQFLNSCAGPIIVKPVDGQASLGVTKVETAADIDQLDFTCTDASLIAEAFLTGPEYSVETFSFNGCHIVLSITQKILAERNAVNPFVEAGHVMPARLSNTDDSSIRNYTATCLDAIGLRDGPGHTEIRLTDNGPRIIETHNRVGGDQIVDLLLLSHDVNVLDLTVTWPLGIIEPLTKSPVPKRATAIRYFMPKPGIVTHVSGTFVARRMHNVVELDLTISIGDVIRPVHESFDRTGYVICVGATPEEAEVACDAAINAIQIQTK